MQSICGSNLLELPRVIQDASLVFFTVFYCASQRAANINIKLDIISKGKSHINRIEKGFRIFFYNQFILSFSDLDFYYALSKLSLSMSLSCE